MHLIGIVFGSGKAGEFYVQGIDQPIGTRRNRRVQQKFSLLHCQQGRSVTMTRLAIALLVSAGLAGATTMANAHGYKHTKTHSSMTTGTSTKHSSTKSGTTTGANMKNSTNPSS